MQKRGGGVATFLLLYSSISFTVCEQKSKASFITFWFFSLLSQPCKIPIQVFIILKHFIICIFLIHSDSLQRMSTALFKSVWNTQKSTHTIVLNTQARCFLILKMFWCLNVLPYFFSSHFYSKGFKFLLTYNFEKYNKTKLALNSPQNFKAMV